MSRVNLVALRLAATLALLGGAALARADLGATKVGAVVLDSLNEAARRSGVHASFTVDGPLPGIASQEPLRLEARAPALAAHCPARHARVLTLVDVYGVGAYLRTIPVMTAWDCPAIPRGAAAVRKTVPQNAPFTAMDVQQSAPSNRTLPAKDSARAAAIPSSSQTAAGAIDDATRAVIRKGAYATVDLADSGIHLQGRVRVMQDGVIGQLVLVKLAGASDMLTARVVADGKLEVEQ